MPIIRRFTKQVIKEAEVDGQEINPNVNTDYTVETEEQENENSNPVERQEQDQIQKNQQIDNATENGDQSTTDYTDESQFPVENDDTGMDEVESNSDNKEEQPVDDLKQTEEEIYSDLTPEQLDIKHKELKTNYLSMYDMVVGIIDRLGDVTTSEEDIPIFEYIITECTKIKDMITDYINSVYHTKSHTENLINYNRFLAVLSGINKILEEMNKKEY